MRGVPLAALVLVALLAGTTLADHVYSHRYVFEGRLHGADGLPLPGREVEFFAEREDFLEPCRDGPQKSITDEWGDFRFCFHHHELELGARAGARYGNATTIRPVDVAFRRSVVTLHETNETGIAPPGWNETHRISGRAWIVGPTDLEGVAVYGVAAVDLPVNLTVRPREGEEQVFQTRTDGFGDFELVVETADPQNTSFTLEARGRGQPVSLDPKFHRVYAPIYLGGDATDPAPQPIWNEGRPGAPGSTTPRVHPGLVVAVALGLVVAVVASRRRS